MADDDVTEQDSPDTEPAETDTDDTTTDPEQDKPEGDGWTPPTREQWEAAQAEHAKTVERLKAASGESAQRKRALAELKKQHETDAEKALREAEEAAQQRLKPALIPISAKAALLEADALPHRAGALSKLIDSDVIEVSGTDVVGLDAEVTRLKSEYPEFFRAAEPPKPAEQPAPKPAEKPKPAATEVGPRKPGPAALSPLEQLAAQIEGRANKQ